MGSWIFLSLTLCHCSLCCECSDCWCSLDHLAISYNSLIISTVAVPCASVGVLLFHLWWNEFCLQHAVQWMMIHWLCPDPTLGVQRHSSHSVYLLWDNQGCHHRYQHCNVIERPLHQWDAVHSSWYESMFIPHGLRYEPRWCMAMLCIIGLASEYLNVQDFDVHDSMNDRIELTLAVQCWFGYIRPLFA